MTLYEVIHGVAFAQAFNFYMQQRSLVPPGTLADVHNSRMAFSQDLEAAQEYAHTQANLAWAFYQKVTPGPVYGWDDDTNTYKGQQAAAQHEPEVESPPYQDQKVSGSQPIIPRPTTPPPPPPPPRGHTSPNLSRTVRDPHLKRTVKVPPVRVPTKIDPREWRNEEVPPEIPGTHPYYR